MKNYRAKIIDYMDGSFPIKFFVSGHEFLVSKEQFYPNFIFTKVQRLLDRSHINELCYEGNFSVRVK